MGKKFLSATLTLRGWLDLELKKFDLRPKVSSPLLNYTTDVHQI